MVLDLNTPLSLWCQLSSFCFFLAGVYGDLLVIRLCCFLAYFLLIVNSLLGSPLWPDAMGTIGSIPLDSVIWALLCLYVHGSSFISLLLDEREVPLTEDQAALWRLLYRTGGLSKRLFYSLFVANTDLTVLELEPGKLIPTEDYFYIIYQGQVQLQVLDPMTGAPTKSRFLVSGEMFNLKYLGLFASEESFFCVGDIKCTSLSSVRLFQIPKQQLYEMAQDRAAKTVFQALLINNLSYAVESFTNESLRSSIAQQDCDRIFRPLEDWEHPTRLAAGSGKALENPLGHLVYALMNSLSLPWPLSGHPVGIRQTQLAPPPRQKPVRESYEVPLFRRLSTSLITRHNRSNDRGQSTGQRSTTIPVSSGVTPSLSRSGSLFNEDLFNTMATVGSRSGATVEISV